MFLVNKETAATAAEFIKPVAVKHLLLALIVPFSVLRHSHKLQDWEISFPF